MASTMTSKKEKTDRNPLRSQGRETGVDYWGEIVTWQAGAENCTYVELREALEFAELSTTVAREFLPRNAFQRALRTLSENRVVRVLEETDDQIKFQFTKEEVEDDAGGDKKYDYKFETFLWLDKKTGAVTCDKTDLRERAQAEVEKCLDSRTASDVTATVQRLYERGADDKPGELRLFPVRRQGGVYFVPEEHTAFNDKVEKFLTKLKGTFDRYVLVKTAADTRTAKGVTTAVVVGLDDLIQEHFKAIDEFGDDTKPGTMERVGDKIKVTRHKIESYASYLDDRKKLLHEKLNEASRALKKRVDGIMAARPADRKRAVVEVDIHDTSKDE